MKEASPLPDEARPGSQRSLPADAVTIGNSSFWNYQPTPARSQPGESPPWALHFSDAAVDTSAAPFRAAFRKLPNGSAAYNLLGRVQIRAAVIHSVGIADLAELAVQHSNRICGSVSHCFRFRGGGDFSATYADTGELLELLACDVTLTVTRDFRFIFQQLAWD